MCLIYPRVRLSLYGFWQESHGHNVPGCITSRGIACHSVSLSECLRSAVIFVKLIFFPRGKGPEAETESGRGAEGERVSHAPPEKPSKPE